MNLSIRSLKDGAGQWAGFGLQRTEPLFALLAAAFLILLASEALAHGVDHKVSRAEAVVVVFSSHHQAAMADVGYRVFSPDGRSLFAQGRTDALGRAVFVPDAPGTWRVLMATDDGHGAKVEVVVEAQQVAAGDINMPVSVGGMNRLTATTAGVGYVLGLGGLLALWRRRTAG